jgi:hypothetical protein
MNPVPDRKTFIRTIRKVIYDDLYDTLKDKNTRFYKIIDSCVRLMYEDNWYNGQKAFFSKNKEWPLPDIMEIYTKVKSLGNMGYGLDVNQAHAFSKLQLYMEEYINSQKINTRNIAIPTQYTEEDYINLKEEDLINDTIDFLGILYNMTEEIGNLSAPIRECVEIFWEYNLTWKRIQRDFTLDDIKNVLGKMARLYMAPYDEASDIGKKFVYVRKYLTDWFYFKNKPRQKPTPDINTRVEELEQQVKELRSQVQALTIDFSREHLPRLERSTLLKQLARHA